MVNEKMSAIPHKRHHHVFLFVIQLNLQLHIVLNNISNCIALLLTLAAVVFVAPAAAAAASLPPVVVFPSLLLPAAAFLPLQFCKKHSSHVLLRNSTDRRVK